MRAPTTHASPKNAFLGVVGFCRCPRPASQVRSFGPGAYRENLLIEAGELDNAKHVCLSCGSTYSAAAPRKVA